MFRLPPRSTLFPSTTLFRSGTSSSNLAAAPERKPPLTRNHHAFLRGEHPAPALAAVKVARPRALHLDRGSGPTPPQADGGDPEERTRLTGGPSTDRGGRAEIGR